jgi:hypothetical protein
MPDNCLTCRSQECTLQIKRHKANRPVGPERYYVQILCTLATVTSRLIDSRQQRKIFTQGGEEHSPREIIEWDGIRIVHPPRVPAADIAVLLAGRTEFGESTPCGCSRRTWFTSGGEGGSPSRSWVKLTSPSPIGGGFILMFLSLLVYSDCISSFDESRWAYVPFDRDKYPEHS